MFIYFFVYFLGMDLVKLTDICGGGTSTEMANQNVLLSNLQKLEDAGKMITGSSRWVIKSAVPYKNKMCISLDGFHLKWTVLTQENKKIGSRLWFAC